MCSLARLRVIRRQLQQKRKIRKRFEDMKTGASIWLKGIAGAFDSLEAEVAADARARRT